MSDRLAEGLLAGYYFLSLLFALLSAFPPFFVFYTCQANLVHNVTRHIQLVVSADGNEVL